MHMEFTQEMHQFTTFYIDNFKQFWLFLKFLPNMTGLTSEASIICAHKGMRGGVEGGEGIKLQNDGE